MIKILIADDQELIRQSLQIMLSSVSNFTVTDTVSNGLEVLESVRREKLHDDCGIQVLYRPVSGEKMV